MGGHEDQLAKKDDIFNHRIQDYVNRVRVCREAVGDDFDLCLEVHRSMSPPEAIAFAKGVEEFNPLFLEDPIAPDSIESLVDVANHIQSANRLRRTSNQLARNGKPKQHTCCKIFAARCLCRRRHNGMQKNCSCC